jgi:hypothetical protein
MQVKVSSTINHSDLSIAYSLLMRSDVEGPLKEHLHGPFACKFVKKAIVKKEIKSESLKNNCQRKDGKYRYYAFCCRTLYRMYLISQLYSFRELEPK